MESSSGAKRRRLTLADGVKVKERSAEHEVGPQRPEKGETKMETDDLWMQLKRKTEDMESHIRRLAGCDRQQGVMAEELSFDKKELVESVKKVANEAGAEQVLESVGVPNEEAMPIDKKAKEAPVPMPAAEHPLLLVEKKQKPAQFTRYQLAKQSGVPNITWSTDAWAWKVQWEVDSKGKKTKRSLTFAVKKFMSPGQAEAEADAAALEAAKAFRTELVEKGILRDSRLKDPNFTSEVPGVRWDKKAEKWRVYIGKSNKVIYGGCFTEKAAAEAKALELREKHGLQLQVKPVPTLANRYAGLPVFHPKVPYPGVTWDLQIQKWHATCHVGGVRRNFRVRPKDHSEADLERSFKEAVAWKKKQEKEKKRKAVKPKAKPRKK